ncbi:Uncharacterised protein [Porphyromonas macacae]|uniref:Nickel uptake substrate-specific transmembrane region n=1 Tax=Porphyromonas macacae TaxID=28115 RepID=A0A379EAD2_9PORP|nr:hypothetical protein [Porphyromonas macacae]SUB89390.1 Uncharacterised protein [Porphyromonas macacae]
MNRRTSLLNKSIISILLFLLMCVAVEAHTMWMETNRTGKIGQKQNISLYFGEFSMKDKTAMKHWMKGMDKGLWQVLTPSGNIIELERTPTDSCYIATFIPQEEGWHCIVFDCRVEEMYRGMKIHYQSIAWVKVGISEKNLITVSPFDQGILFLPPVSKEIKTGQMACFPLSVRNDEYKGVRVSLLGDTGWKKDFYRYPNKAVEFMPLWAGRYLLHSTITRDLTETESSKYPEAKKIYDTITYYFEVK